VLERRAKAERQGPGWFGLSVWCGLDEDGTTARTVLGGRMQALYRLPPERFVNVTAAGTPEQVAEWLAPYVDAGAGSISIVPAARSVEAGVELAGEVRRLLGT